ncbi:MAG: hypothetical protein GF414_00700 [Candidatus Altiarchaeales archaeon]|nr:hypothetical protein [Candidatus Altiarchaeales archaeon]
MTEELQDSIQTKPKIDKEGTLGMMGDVSNPSMARLLQLTIHAQMKKAPSYWSKARDEWLVDFVKEPGNDLLAGAVSTVTAKIVANPWYVEGPLELARFARNQLLYWSNFHGGWDQFIGPWVQGFLNRDAGGVAELIRSSPTDLEGPALGYAHLDESKLYPTGDPEYPFKYRRDPQSKEDKGGMVPVHRNQMMRIVDMPSGKDADKGVGFCSVSRCLTTALTLMDVVKYKRERLSDLPPAGLLLLNNMGEREWDDLTANYNAEQYNRGNEVWRRVMVAFGIDPAYPLQAELVPFSELPEHFDDKAFIEMTVYSFALGFREDPRDFWPVSSGPLGTATEAEIQARSARLKGEGIICAAIERQLNRAEGMPEGVVFHFDFQDDQQDMLEAELHDMRSQTIRRFWEPPTGSESNDGIITTEEARQWAVRERIIPWDVLQEPIEIDRLYDTKGRPKFEGFGPTVRYYQNGACISLGGVRGAR